MFDAALLPARDDRVTLRAMAPEDARAYAEGTEDPAVRRYGHLPEPKYTASSVSALIEGPIRDGLRRGDLAVLTIAVASTDEFAGSLVLFGTAEDSIEVGFWIHPDHRAKGFAAAALALAVELARRSGFTSLLARTVPENVASQRTLERSGFVPGAPTREIAPSGQAATLVPYRRALKTIAPVPLETERLQLRLHEHADAKPLHHLYSRPDVARYLLDEPWTESDTGRHLSERMVRTRIGDGSTALALAMEHDGTTIGDVQLWLTNAEHGIAEIGWVLDPAWGGRGLASEAVRAVLELAIVWRLRWMRATKHQHSSLNASA